MMHKKLWKFYKKKLNSVQAMKLFVYFFIVYGLSISVHSYHATEVRKKKFKSSWLRITGSIYNIGKGF